MLLLSLLVEFILFRAPKFGSGIPVRSKLPTREIRKYFHLRFV